MGRMACLRGGICPSVILIPKWWVPFITVVMGGLGMILRTKYWRRLRLGYTTTGTALSTAVDLNFCHPSIAATYQLATSFFMATGLILKKTRRKLDYLSVTRPLKNGGFAFSRLMNVTLHRYNRNTSMIWRKSRQRSAPRKNLRGMGFN